MEVYTHRSGRTARAGKSGICISICQSRESYKIRQLEKMVNATFSRLDIPSGKDVCRKQFFHFMEKLINADISNSDYETYTSDLTKKFEDISKEEVLKRVAALEFDHFLKYYKNADDLNVKIDRDRRIQNNNVPTDRRDRSSHQRDSGFTKLFINIGTKDGFYKASFLQYILDESNLKKEVLGRIDLRDMNAWVEVDKSAAPKMIKSLDGKTHNGRQIRMNEADGGGNRRPPNREKRKRIPAREGR
jgi:ATP-dependent RNA helicase DeaD